MKRYLVLACLVAGALSARQRAQGFCQQGNQLVTTSGINSTTKVQASYPGCLVTVYAAGTVTPSTIYLTSAGTPLSNPFTADANGYWFFYANDAHYDIKLSSGGLPAPWTISDVILCDGCAAAGAVTSVFTQTGAVPNLSGDCATSGSSATVCTKTNGTSFAPSATTDATNAANLSSGTVPAARMPALTGDITSSVGTVATTLATVNSAPGACGDSTHVCAVTTNGKGLVTAQTATAIASGNVTGPGSSTAGDVPKFADTTGKVLADGYGLVTTVGSPGSDTNIPSEKAIRTAIGAGGGVTTGVTLTSGRLVVGAGASTVGVGDLSGDVTTAGGTAATLATVNSGPGACGDATHVCQVTTNGKGLVTAQAAVGITANSVTSVFGRTGAVAATSGDYTTATVPESGSLYYTDARARASVSATSPLSYNSSTGVFSANALGAAGATLFSTTGSTAVTASSATTLIGAVTGSTTFASNLFSAGAMLQVLAEGFYTTPASTRTLKIDLKIGGTVQLTTGTITVLPSVTSGVWRLLCGITTRTAGVSGTQIGNCLFEMGASSTSVLTPANGSMQTASAWTVDTTGSLAFDLQAAWDATTGAPSITSSNVAAWIPGAPVSSVAGLAGVVAGQGTDTKVMTAGTVAGTGATLCTDAQGGATTSGCAASGVTSVGGLTGVVPGGLILVEQHAASSSAELDFTTCFSGTYDTYLLTFKNVTPATNGAKLQLQAHASGGGYDTGNNYNYGLHYSGSSSSSDGYDFLDPADAVYFGGGGVVTINGTAANGGVSGEMFLADPLSTSIVKRVSYDVSVAFSGGDLYYKVSGHGTWATSGTAMDGVRIKFDSGNLASGTVRCYGVAKQ